MNEILGEVSPIFAAAAVLIVYFLVDIIRFWVKEHFRFKRYAAWAAASRPDNSIDTDFGEE
jgi:hypothetical protein